ncbi:sigma-70 family RNA polymerase sigma factor [Lentibacillus jeotgali]|uniref:sigma-70 family RNA polymerase sigma factor n=1 Tax=Lentibacillus jeotgali TaxID=558169 RepID=UPI0002627874|nr:sigma-70 family RNA polymerase sigma factor [Lentibacillus jeotgali]
MEFNSLTKHVDSDAQTLFKSFTSQHSQALSNYVVQRFLSQESNYQLFTTAICFPTEDNWRKLDQAFRQFYTEIRFINYIAKVLWRYAKDFRVKYQRDEARYLVILDESIQIKGESSAITYKDQLAEHSEDSTPKGESLQDQVEDVQLQKALNQLTDKQLKVLDSYYVHNMTQKEIARNLGGSQQSVSKILQTTLDKLKESYGKGEKRHVFR